MRHEEVHRLRHQLSRQGGELLPRRRVPLLDDEIVALDIAESPQRLPEGGHRHHTLSQSTDPVHLARGLDIGDQWQRKEAQGERDDVPAGSAPHGGLLLSAAGRPVAMCGRRITVEADFFLEQCLSVLIIA